MTDLRHLVLNSRIGCFFLTLFIFVVSSIYLHVVLALILSDVSSLSIVPNKYEKQSMDVIDDTRMLVPSALGVINGVGV